MEAIERLNAALPAGWRFLSLEPYDGPGGRYELNVEGPTPPFITSLFTRGNTPDEAVDKFLAEMRRMKKVAR